MAARHAFLQTTLEDESMFMVLVQQPGKVELSMRARLDVPGCTPGRRSCGVLMREFAATSG
jgi:hypothetical protein